MSDITPDRRAVVLGLGAMPLMPGQTVADPDRPAAVARVAPERFDDLMWENDRVAYRIYGPALEAEEPPSGSGIDVWAKRVRRPFMDRQLASGRYHEDHGEGLDFYDVGRSRGVGGLGVWHDNKLWTSRNYRNPRILSTGGDLARFTVDYAPWPVDVIRKVWETRTVALPLGSSFTRMTSVIHSDSSDPLIVGIGICKRRNAQGVGSVSRDPRTAQLTFREPDDPGHGALSLSVVADPRQFAGFAQDAENNLLLITVEPGRAFTYFTGSAWSRGLDFPTAEAWDAHLASQRFDFTRQA
ncbi:MAG: DUF4861 domain-containing protein [Brevundimonas sp.]|nr:MAG: DUF4861 domain-containing protein [Brevundimonas sp.]